MKRMTWAFVAIALIGILSAFKNYTPLGSEKIAAFSFDANNNRYYVQVDASQNPVIISPDWQKGEEYDCIEGDICTITLKANVDPNTALQEGPVGQFYYEAADVEETLVEDGEFVLN